MVMVGIFKNHRHSIVGEKKPSPFHRLEKLTIVQVYLSVLIWSKWVKTNNLSKKYPNDFRGGWDQKYEKSRHIWNVSMKLGSIRLHLELPDWFLTSSWQCVIAHGMSIANTMSLNHIFWALCMCSSCMQGGHWGSDDYRLPVFFTILSTNYRLFNTLSTSIFRIFCPEIDLEPDSQPNKTFILRSLLISECGMTKKLKWGSVYMFITNLLYLVVHIDGYVQRIFKTFKIID